jgi:hypothetical protein
MKEMPIIEKSDSLENLAQQMLDFYKELQALLLIPIDITH